ncbi:uncharacterized protein Z520_09138 [Fonsecaea multimorphosa CBS 102226]|uniref:Uncharacterized protein n=1 Tax=Fonsecaea multimorphosa CBS 102226 TaxID=1442371 RepID=A0A0D2JPD8_9EURO|nr:uncharacterized protein Z520_09138 [Fonsecaea multimorphosa CBS 102226]KIX95222.1 hypothetical protein Z520_09138 [Fonsecaea multimorphosa CBS 102226]OAL17284.1 hypothetical protein AYO22_11850 [Fonsecaea multimorphosa]
MAPLAGLWALMAACLMLFQEKGTDMILFFNQKSAPIFRNFLAIEPPPAVTTTLVSTIHSTIHHVSTITAPPITSTTTFYAPGYSAVVVTLSTPPATTPTTTPLLYEPFPAFSYAAWQTVDSCIPEAGWDILAKLFEGLVALGTALAEACAHWEHFWDTFDLAIWVETYCPPLSLPPWYPHLYSFLFCLLFLAGASRVIGREDRRRLGERLYQRWLVEQDERRITRQEVAKALDQYRARRDAGAAERTAGPLLDREMDLVMFFALQRLRYKLDQVEKDYRLGPVLSSRGIIPAVEAERAVMEAMWDRRCSPVLRFIYSLCRSVWTFTREAIAFWGEELFLEVWETILPVCLLMSVLAIAFVLGTLALAIGLVGSICWLSLMGTTIGASVARPVVEGAKGFVSELLRPEPPSSTGNEGLSSQQTEAGEDEQRARKRRRVD